MRPALSYSLAAASVTLAVSLVACNHSDAVTSEPSAATAAPSASAKRRAAKKKKKVRTKRADGPAVPVATAKPVAHEQGELAEPAELTLSADDAAAPSSGAVSCPDDMQLVSGDYCRNVAPRCLEYVSDVEGSPDLSRCKRFASPVVCTDSQPRRPMQFCMDRYEWPNKKGELPHTLMSWEDAARLCNSAGKRLCTESEFNFACEGPELYPHATGHVRDAEKCNIDREFKKRRREFLPREQCEASPSCKKEFDRLDGREPSGSRPECVSPFGIYDLNGNVNEWVSMPWQAPGKRSAIKGGWWGPVRNRCRPIVQSHGETYIGYEVGFRCCSGTETEADRAARKAAADVAAPAAASGAQVGAGAPDQPPDVGGTAPQGAGRDGAVSLAPAP